MLFNNVSPYIIYSIVPTSLIINYAFQIYHKKTFSIIKPGYFINLIFRTGKGDSAEKQYIYIPAKLELPETADIAIKTFPCVTIEGILLCAVFPHTFSAINRPRRKYFNLESVPLGSAVKKPVKTVIFCYQVINSHHVLMA